MDSEEAANQAIKGLNGRDVKGRPMKVRENTSVFFTVHTFFNVILFTFKSVYS